MDETKTDLVPIRNPVSELPPILVGRATPAVVAPVEYVYHPLAEMLERWVARRASPHTRRDREIIKTFLDTGIRIGTGCRLRVRDFHQDGDEATIALHEKGDKHRRIGLHFAAAEAIAEYIRKAGLTKGPLFRAQRHSRKKE